MEHKGVHEVEYIPIDNQPSSLVALHESKIVLDFRGEKKKEPEDVSVWFVKVRTHGEVDAVLKVFHNLIPTDMEAESLESAKRSAANIWNLWNSCHQPEEQQAVISARETAVVRLKAEILDIEDRDHREGDDHPFKGKTVAGVLMRRMGKPLGTFKDYPTFSEEQVLVLVRTMGLVLDVFKKVDLVHCDVKEQNIVHDPQDYHKYVLIDYCDIKRKGDSYLPLSEWCFPNSGFDSMKQREYAIKAVPAIDRLMLFFACMRLLMGKENGTEKWSNITNTFKNIRDADLKKLLIEPFPEIERYEDEPDGEYLERRLRWALK